MAKYFTIEELTKSSTATRLGISNTPGIDEMTCLYALIDNILDPLRVAYGKPIIVNSGYRSARLNKKIGGEPKSQHKLGQAADIRSLSDKPEDNKVLFDMIRKLNLPFDQLINEFNYDWIHVSYGPRNRREVLLSKKVNGKTVYTKVQ